MNDKFQILKNMAKECNREDISLKDYAVKLADDYSKVCKSNFKLQQEKQQLKDRFDKAIKHISKEFLCYDNESDEYIQGLKAIEILKGDKDDNRK